MSKYCCTLALIAVCIGSSVCLAQSSREQKWEPPDSQFADALDEAIVKNSAYRAELFESLTALGVEAVPGIRHYLKHPKIDVRQRALYVLLQLPQVARESLLEALKGEDEYLRREALRLAEVFMNDPEVGQAWVNCFTKLVDPVEGGRSDAFQMFRRLAPEIRKPLEEPLVVGILENLEKYSAGNTAVMVTVVGEIARPGDGRVLEALRKVGRVAETRFLRDGPNWWDIEASQRRVQRVVEAVHFAEGNLGIRRGLEQFAEGFRRADRKGKRRLLRLVGRFRPTSDVLEIVVIPTLRDQSPLVRATSHSDRWVRVCDHARFIVQEWFDDTPPPKYGPLSDDDLKAWESWLRQRIEQMDETSE